MGSREVAPMRSESEPDWEPLVSAVASCAVGFVVARRDPGASAAQLAELADHRLAVLAAAQERIDFLGMVDDVTRSEARRWLQAASGHVGPRELEAPGSVPAVPGP